ncbi:hypothetical protein [Actinomyces wuliandei]|uniref:hypothetical protein n=1 Tax=Actinomyces wuliandei TaxID=2057743 RepID=UPI0015D5A84D|nr:hypothetical protein [Actinomyces wuliandei]
MRVSRAEWVVEHLVFLAQAQDHVLGPDFSAATAEVAASIAAGVDPNRGNGATGGSGSDEGAGGPGSAGGPRRRQR